MREYAFIVLPKYIINSLLRTLINDVPSFHIHDKLYYEFNERTLTINVKGRNTILYALEIGKNYTKFAKTN